MNFQAVLLQPHKKSATKRLREVLNSVFRHLDEVAAASVLDVGLWPRTRCGLQSGPPLHVGDTVTKRHSPDCCETYISQT